MRRGSWTMVAAALACAAPAVGQAPRVAYPPGAEEIAAVLTPGVGKIGPLDAHALGLLVDTLLGRAVERDALPGAAVAIVQDGRVVLLRGYGFADVARRRPVDPERTIFRVGSVSKPLTAVAVMQLVERGRLRLDADVSPLLPDLGIEPAFPEPITVHHLLTHTAGLDTRLSGTAAPTEEGVRTLGEYLADDLPPRVRAPGRVVAYSNHGYSLLGHLVERLSGEEFADYMARRVFAPLGMTRSGFRFGPDVRPEAAVGYEPARGGNVLAPPIHPHIVPAASMVTTAADMARFMIWQLEGSAGGVGAALADSTLRRMQARRFTAHAGIPGVAYGLFESYFRGQRLLFHSGGIHGYMAAVYLWPEQRVGLFVADNGYRADPILSVLRTFMGRAFPYHSAVPFPPAGTRERTERVVGSYRLANHPRTSLEKAGGIRNPTLDAKRLADGSLSLFGLRMLEAVPGVYREIEGDETAAFEPLGGGGMRLTTTYPWPGTETWERVPWWSTALPNQLLLGLTFLLSLGALLRPVPWRRRLPSFDRGAAPAALDARARALVRAVAALDLAVVLLPILGARSAGRAGLQYGVPWQMDAGATLAIGCALLLPLLAWLAIEAVRADRWSIGERIALGGLAAVQLLFVLQLHYWNLLGIRH